MIVQSNAPITLVGGGSLRKSDLRAAMRHAPRVVAADSGADAAFAAGAEPEVVIGDLDSLSAAGRARIPMDRQHLITEQDSTDFDKALRSIDAPLVIGVGFLGKRLDHQLAACNTLVRYPDRRAVLTSADSVVFLAPPEIALDLAAATIVSLFPLGAVEGWSEGLVWPIGGLNFTPDGGIGTSNRALGLVQLGFTAPKMLVVLPARCLEAVVEGLDRSAARW